MAAPATLPPLTGSALFDPWRLRHRELLATGGQPPPERRPTRTHRFSADHVERDVVGVAREIEVLAIRRAAELAGSVPLQHVPVPGLDEPDVEERLLQFPPEKPGWSAYLPACRTVLPAVAARRTLRELLARL